MLYHHSRLTAAAAGLFLLAVGAVTPAWGASFLSESALLPPPVSITPAPENAAALLVTTHPSVAVIDNSDTRVLHGLNRLLSQWEQGTAKASHRSFCKGYDICLQQLPTFVGANGATVRPAGTVDESYEVDVTSRQLHITYRTPEGGLRALATVAQLGTQAKGHVVMPTLHIADHPRFAWRGLMIDSARHFISVAALERHLDGMAAVKMNIFHWHLTDDQGFRVQSARFPELHQQGSGGKFYSRDDVRHIVAYAHARGIRVIPEFDMPGHASSILASHPELASQPGTYGPPTTWGIFDAALDPTLPETYDFIDAFLADMATLFPDPYLHVGGDEVTGKHWLDNPRISAFMQERGMTLPLDLQTYFINRVAQIAAKHGKHIVGWDEVLQPGLHPSTVVQSWRGTASLAQTVREGYYGILSAGYYLDSPATVAERHSVDPLSGIGDLNDDEKARILGGEACMWTELVHQDTLDTYVWPATAAVADRLWSAEQKSPDAEALHHRIDVMSVHLERFGLTHRTGPGQRLERLSTNASREALQTLASVLVPWRANWWPGFTHVDNPLNGLADALPTESLVARDLEAQCDALVANGPPYPASPHVRGVFTTVARNDATLKKTYDNDSGVLEVSLQVRLVSELALEALDILEGRSNAFAPTWAAHAEGVLARASEKRAGVRIAVLPAVRLLVGEVASLGEVVPPAAEQ